MTGALRGFLMSDLEGSNQLWATAPESMSEAVRVLDAEVGAAVLNHHGTLLKARGEGDSHFAVFALGERGGDIGVCAAIAAPDAGQRARSSGSNRRPRGRGRGDR